MNQYWKKGSVLHREAPFLAMITKDNVKTHCTYCFKKLSFHKVRKCWQFLFRVRVLLISTRFDLSSRLCQMQISKVLFTRVFRPWFRNAWRRMFSFRKMPTLFWYGANDHQINISPQSTQWMEGLRNGVSKQKRRM